ncbi:phage holin [Lactobacillus delbrueckii]|nr:phage holin [Lactobacillus delbrueckii]
MLRRVMKRLLNNGWHCIVGFSLIFNGLVLAISTRYFFWPPHPKFITDFLNDDIVGYTGILIGVGMIHWAYQESGSYKMNRFLLASSSAFYTMLGLTELMHSLFAHPFTPRMEWGAISDLVMVLVTLYMARDSPMRKDE